MRAESGLSEQLISVVCPPEVPYNGAGFRRPNSNFSSSMSRLKRLNFSLVGLLPLLVLAGPAEARVEGPAAFVPAGALGIWDGFVLEVAAAGADRKWLRRVSDEVRDGSTSYN